MRKSIIFIIGLLCIVTNGLANEQSLPKIGGFDTISEEDQRILGRNWLYTARNNLPLLINSPQLQEYIENLVYEMSSYSSVFNPSYEIAIVRDNQINAFAVTGGILGLHLGLITSLDDEDELASVIAHELGHLSQKHYLEMLYASKSRENISLGGLLAAIGMIFTGMPSAAFITIVGGMALNAEHSLEMIRLNEEEADNTAIDILNKSNRNPSAMVSMLERLYRKYGDGNTPLIFRTHPLTKQRISNARTQVQNNVKYEIKDGYKQEKLAFFMAQVLAKIHLARDYNLLIENLEYEIKIEKQEIKQDGLQYGLANVYLLNGDSAKTKLLLEPLRKKYPLSIYIQNMIAQADFLLGNIDEAEKQLVDLLQFNPNNYVLTSHLSDMYITQGKYEQAKTLLEEQSERRKNDIWVWSKLNSVYGKLGLIHKNHYARAEILFLLGRYEAAIEQLNYARKKTEYKFFKVQVNKRQHQIERWMAKLNSL